MAQTAVTIPQDGGREFQSLQYQQFRGMSHAGNLSGYNKTCYIQVMEGPALKQARLAAGRTQAEAARRLGITQAYLSMVERGARPVSRTLASKAAKVFQVPATDLALGAWQPHGRDDRYFKTALARLGYPGFGYLRGGRKRNPAEVMMDALDADNLDPRVTEALPWLAVVYPGMNWDWLTSQAKLRDRQNRLAYLLTVAEKKSLPDAARTIAARVAELERSRLAREDTLCAGSMTQAERKWLRAHRPAAAAHWNLLTDLTAEQLDYA